MNRNTTIGAAIAALKKEAADSMSAAAIFEALIAPRASGAPTSSAGGEPAAASRARRGIIVPAAIEILRAHGRPMHGLTEILPALAERGIPASRAGLAATLLRSGEIVRAGRGNFALKLEDEHPVNSADMADKRPKASVS